MAKRIITEAPDSLTINNLHYSFRTPPFLSFHIVTGYEQKYAFYAIDKVHLYIISSFKEFLVQNLKTFVPTKPAKEYLEPSESFNFVDVRHNRYMGYYDFNIKQFNDYTEKAKQMLSKTGINFVNLSNHNFSIYDIFYFVDAYNAPKKEYLGGRMWDRASMVDSPENTVSYPACSMYPLEYDKIEINQTKSSLLKIIKRAYENNQLFVSPMVSTNMAIEYGDKIAYLDITPAVG